MNCIKNIGLCIYSKAKKDIITVNSGCLANQWHLKLCPVWRKQSERTLPLLEHKNWWSCIAIVRQTVQERQKEQGLLFKPSLIYGTCSHKMWRWSRGHMTLKGDRQRQGGEGHQRWLDGTCVSGSCISLNGFCMGNSRMELLPLPPAWKHLIAHNVIEDSGLDRPSLVWSTGALLRILILMVMIE